MAQYEPGNIQLPSIQHIFSSLNGASNPPSTTSKPPRKSTSHAILQVPTTRVDFPQFMTHATSPDEVVRLELSGIDWNSRSRIKNKGLKKSREMQRRRVSAKLWDMEQERGLLSTKLVEVQQKRAFFWSKSREMEQQRDFFWSKSREMEQQKDLLSAKLQQVQAELEGEQRRDHYFEKLHGRGSQSSRKESKGKSMWAIADQFFPSDNQGSHDSFIRSQVQAAKPPAHGISDISGGQYPALEMLPEDKLSAATQKYLEFLDEDVIRVQERLSQTSQQHPTIASTDSGFP